MRRRVTVTITVTTGEAGDAVRARVKHGRRRVRRGLIVGPDASPGLAAAVEEYAEELTADIVRRLAAPRR